MRKVFVDVVVEHSKEGEIKPISFIWDDGIKYNIDRVFENQKAASLKVGGQGSRYRCRVSGKDTYLYLEDGRWFIEGK